MSETKCFCYYSCPLLLGLGIAVAFLTWDWSIGVFFVYELFIIRLYPDSDRLSLTSEAETQALSSVQDPTGIESIIFLMNR